MRGKGEDVRLCGGTFEEEKKPRERKGKRALTRKPGERQGKDGGRDGERQGTMERPRAWLAGFFLP